MASILSGCGKEAGQENGSAVGEASGTEAAGEKEAEGGNGTESGNAEGEMPNLVVSYAYAAVPDDLDKVEAAINEITKEKIGCTVTLEAFTYGNIDDQITLILSSPSEQLDVMFGRFLNGMASFVEKGQLTPLNNLLDEHGQGIQEVLGEKYIKAASLNGECYGLTTCRDMASQISCMFRKDIIDELEIDLSQVKTYDDLTPVFEQIHEAHPELYVTGGGSAPQTRFLVKNYGKIDFLGNLLGVLEDYDKPVVTNLFESEAWKGLVRRNTEWNQAGYIYPDICTDSSSSVQMLLSNGVAASYFQVFKPGAVVENENTVQNYELVAAPVESPVSFTSNVQNWMWAIPTNSKNPGKAMEFLNLLYTDADLINLFSFGIEGEHYVLNEEGFATDGPNTAAYADKASWKAGNAYLSHIWEGDDADLYEQLQAFNESAAQSCAMGFVMDNSTVSSEYTALQSVLAKYEVMLEWGFAGDVDATIEEFNKALYDAGLQAYMDEKQRQLDEFIASKE